MGIKTDNVSPSEVFIKIQEITKEVQQTLEYDVKYWDMVVQYLRNSKKRHMINITYDDFIMRAGLGNQSVNGVDFVSIYINREQLTQRLRYHYTKLLEEGLI